MANQITDRQFWQTYWSSKEGLDIKVKRTYTFHRILQGIIEDNRVNTAIELGGFPGYYALFLRKYFGLSSTLLDYYIDHPTLEKVLRKNGLTEADVNIIETDLFDYEPLTTYDLVLSCGLIEHFEDTHDIVRRHVQFMEEDGVLFISLPNFRGLNGWVQRKFDMANYAKHNVNSMDLSLLETIGKELGLKEVKVRYYGKFTVWLENKDEKPFLVRLFVRGLWFAGKALTTIIPFESKFLSPYIVFVGKK